MLEIDYEKETQWLLYQVGIKVDIKQNKSNLYLRDILRHFGIRYRVIPLAKDMDGSFIRREGHGDSPHWIFINAERPPTRQRFSLGHEIGHFWLGHSSGITLHSMRDQSQEVQANRFSASLLLPAEALFKIHCCKSSIKEIADWFRVSEISTAIRLSRLGLRTEEAELVISEYWSNQGDGEFYDNPIFDEVAVTERV